MQDESTPTPVSSLLKTTFTAYFIVVAGVIAYLIAKLWPGPDLNETHEVLFGGLIELTVLVEVRYLALVMLVGALGSYIHAATSFTVFAGNRKLYTSWLWWYTLRPFIGMALALLFYFVFRGGLLSAGAGAESISIFGIVAAAGLVGMFSKQATDKLAEVAEALFRRDRDKPDNSDSLQPNE